MAATTATKVAATASAAAGKPASAKPAPGKPTAAKAAPATAAEPASEPLEDQAEPGYIASLLRDSPSWLTSLIVHMALLLLLALWMLPAEIKSQIGALSVNPNQKEEEIEEIIDEPVEELKVEVDQVPDMTPQPETDNIQPETMFSPAQDAEAAAAVIEAVDDIGLLTSSDTNLMQSMGAVNGHGLSGRGAASRRALVAQGGGSPDSEKAVAMALRWLAEHQMPDGGWSFDHRASPLCQGRCPDQGSMANARTAATAMALLPFLGAGQTHKEGDYQKTVMGGLYFLVKSMKVGPNGGDLQGGANMYAHGLASIAVCEAYAMTQDRGLAAPAQAAINFIVYAQDPVGGGWRYGPKQAGDTSVVGWQIMALKSGHLAYLAVPPNTIRGASAFLDSVQVDSGSGYGYTTPGRGQATTAVGLLCRMYLGWKKDHPGLQRGVEILSKQGPAINGNGPGAASGNMYYNYYASQVMFQATSAKGDMWKKWNDKMRDTLVLTQAQDGHTKGSWIIKGDHGSEVGGRVYSTSMATMVLEVYYRHMPIFRESAVEEEFPL